jgi:hypothetical protein
MGPVWTFCGGSGGDAMNLFVELVNLLAIVIVTAVAGAVLVGLRHVFVVLPRRRRAAKGLPPRTPRRYTGGPR